MLKKTHLLLAALLLGIVSGCAATEVAKTAQPQAAGTTVKAAPKAEKPKNLPETQQ